MGNSFKFIKVIAIIAVILIVVTLGIFVFKNSHSFVKSVNLSKYEIDEFNGKWLNYEGLQNGSSISGLFQKLASNAEENKNAPEKLIDVAYNITDGSEFNVINSTVRAPKANEFKSAMGGFVSQHAYIVELIYSENTGLVSGILIKSNRNDKYELIPNEK